MMLPDPCAFITGAARLAQRKCESRQMARHSLPVGEFHVVDGSRRALDAGIVHQHVQPAQIFQRFIEPGVDLGFVGDIHMGCGDLREFLAEGGERLLVDIADVDLGAFIIKGLGNGAANACGGGGDHDALWHVISF